MFNATLESDIAIILCVFTEQVVLSTNCDK